MSAPNQFGPPPPSAGNSGRTVLIVVLGTLGVVAIVCCGICSGCMYMAQKGAGLAEKFAKEGLNHFLLEPAFNDAYLAVLADERIQERLGDPVKAVESGVTLWRRSGSGELKPEGETLQFDIEGPRGKAIVSVVATHDVATSEIYKPAKITVTFSDGSVIDVEPPKEPVDPRAEQQDAKGI